MWTVPAAAKGKFYLIRTPLLDQGFVALVSYTFAYNTNTPPRVHLKPQNEIFTKNRPAWVQVTEGVAQWEGMRK
jgi:hypothetical protein